MSQLVALSTIEARVITLCGLPETLTSDTNPNANQLLDLMRVASGLLAGLVSSEYPGEFFFATTGTLATVANTATVAVPTNFSDLLSLTWQKSTTEEVPLTRATPEDMRAYPASWTSTECGPIYYRPMGTNLRFWPTPAAVHTLNVIYSTGIYPSTTSSTFTARDGWDQWITLQTCILVRARQEKDASDFGMQLEKVEAAIRRQIKRDRFGVRRVRDLRGDMYSSVGYPRKPW